jgi:hypothetical protein
MPTLWAQTTEFASISVGDDLPILVKFDFRPPVQPGTDAPPESPVGAEKLTAYVKELLFKGFPADSVNKEDTVIETEGLIDFLPGDTISVCGRVASKSEEEGRRLVECAVTVESQDGVVLATARAVVSL